MQYQLIASEKRRYLNQAERLLLCALLAFALLQIGLVLTKEMWRPELADPE